MNTSCSVQPKEAKETYIKAGEILANKALSVYAEKSIDNLLTQYEGDLFPKPEFIDMMSEYAYDPVEESDYDVFFDKIFQGLDAKYPDASGELFHDHFDISLKQRFGQYYTEHKKEIQRNITKRRAIIFKKTFDNEYKALGKAFPGVTDKSPNAFIAKRAGDVIAQKTINENREEILENYTSNDLDDLVNDLALWYEDSKEFDIYFDKLDSIVGTKSRADIDYYTERFFKPAVRATAEQWLKTEHAKHKKEVQPKFTAKTLPKTTQEKKSIEAVDNKAKGQILYAVNDFIKRAGAGINGYEYDEIQEELIYMVTEQIDDMLDEDGRFSSSYIKDLSLNGTDYDAYDLIVERARMGIEKSMPDIWVKIEKAKQRYS